MERQSAQNQSSRRFAPKLVLIAGVYLAFACTTAATGSAPVEGSKVPVVTAASSSKSPHHPPSPRPAVSVLEENFAEDNAKYVLAPSRPKVALYRWHHVQSEGKRIPHQVYRPPRTTDRL